MKIRYTSSLLSPEKLIAGLIAFVLASLLSLVAAPYVFAAAADGIGPWADEVVSAALGKNKNGTDIIATRSDTSQALGVAEGTDAEGTFTSLGFPSGSITLKFTNPVYNGPGTDISISESTHTPYPDETASVEVSADGSTFVAAGSVTFDGEISLPDSLSCARYVRLTNTSNPALFEDTADGFDVDGVKALHSEGTCPETTTPSPTPSSSSSSSSSSNSGNNGSGEAPKCTVQAPPKPTITAITRLSPTSALIMWSGVSPVTHYAISYGKTPGNYKYGVLNAGNGNSFTVEGLEAGINYYFIVYGVNDCAPSEHSNEMSIAPTTTKLGATGGSDNEIFLTLAAFVGLGHSLLYFLRKKNLS